MRRLLAWAMPVTVLYAAAAAPARAQPAYQQLRIIAPAAPGGGWDRTARVMQQVLQRHRAYGIRREHLWCSGYHRARAVEALQALGGGFANALTALHDFTDR
jgi:hypothetical protein